MQILENCSSNIQGISFIHSVNSLIFNFPFVSRMINSFLYSFHIHSIPLSLFPHLCSLSVTPRSILFAPFERSLMANTFHLRHCLRHNILFILRVLTKMSNFTFPSRYTSIHAFLVRFTTVHCGLMNVFVAVGTLFQLKRVSTSIKPFQLIFMLKRVLTNPNPFDFYLLIMYLFVK